jgi:adenylylsulfate kinase
VNNFHYKDIASRVFLVQREKIKLILFPLFNTKPNNTLMDLYFSDSLPVSRLEKEKRLNQKARAIWMTGLSGSGKSTLGLGLEKELMRRGFLVQILDGDLVRTGINNNLTFSVSDRLENIRRIAEVSKLFIHCGIITIDCFISPTNEIRTLARDIIGKDDFIEIYMNASIEACEERDAKGLYAKARRGEIRDFTGIGSPFEAPAHPDLELNTSELSVQQTIETALRFILPKITFSEG